MSPVTSPRMPRRDLVLGGALIGASALAFALQPRARESTAPLTLESAIPRRIGTFRAGEAGGFVLPPAGPLTERTYLDVLTRLYQAEGMPPVMLLIAQGRAEDPGMSVHRPERCYRSAGFSIDKPSVMTLPAPFPAGAQANCMTARREDRVEQVFFWTRIGSSFPVSATAQRLTTIRENLAGVLPPGMLFRLSIISEDAPAAFAMLSRFHAAMLASLDAATRAALLGR